MMASGKEVPATRHSGPKPVLAAGPGVVTGAAKVAPLIRFYRAASNFSSHSRTRSLAILWNIEPDRQISRIRLADKTSRLCFRVQRHLQFLNTVWS
jgi:hypothetical protein